METSYKTWIILSGWLQQILAQYKVQWKNNSEMERQETSG